MSSQKRPIPLGNCGMDALGQNSFYRTSTDLNAVEFNSFFFLMTELLDFWVFCMFPTDNQHHIHTSKTLDNKVLRFF